MRDPNDRKLDDKRAIIDNQNFEGTPEPPQKHRKIPEVDELDILLFHTVTDIYLHRIPEYRTTRLRPACERTLGKRS